MNLNDELVKQINELKRRVSALENEQKIPINTSGTVQLIGGSYPGVKMEAASGTYGTLLYQNTVDDLNFGRVRYSDGALAGSTVVFAMDGSTNVIHTDSNGTVSIGTAAHYPSAKLRIDSTTGGLLLPRMTTAQRDAMTAYSGLVVYNTNTNQINYYNGSTWVAV